MARQRRSDGRIWLEEGEFEQIPSTLRNQLRYQPAGLMDNYIIGWAKSIALYIPIVDAIKFVRSHSACLPAYHYQKSVANNE